MTKIYRKLKRRRVALTHVCEVGVYLPEYSNVLDFIGDGVRAMLVEADPQTVEKIEAFFAGRDHVTIHPVAVYDHNGTIKLAKAAASTYVAELAASPAIVNDRHRAAEDETLEVPCRLFSELDDGTIDLLSVDIEGCEWYVINHLRSRPHVISVETHGKAYVNPFLQEITAWMEQHDYVVWYKDRSDTVFIRRGLFVPSLGDWWETKFSELRVAWKKFRLGMR